MIIERDRAKIVFNKYVKKYDSSDGKIRLKIEHTYRVSELCEKIAVSLNLKEEEVDIAWLTGLLHDIGRFEQVRRYGTFNDSKSVNHAELGCEILFKDGKIREFIEDHSEDKLLEAVIRNHNGYEIPEEISSRCKVFTNILRDADKIDIFRVNVLSSVEDVYDVIKEEVYVSEVSTEVMESFRKKDTVLRSLKKTAVDNIVGHISLIFGLVYKESIKIAKEQGYLMRILEFKSENHTTNRQFDEIRKVVVEFIEKGTF